MKVGGKDIVQFQLINKLNFMSVSNDIRSFK